MPGQFEGFGIALLYPDSWILDSEVAGDSVSIESPDGAFLTIAKCENATHAQEVLVRARAAMQDEYEEVECESIVKQLNGLTLTGEVLRFVYLDLIITSQLLLLTHEETIYFVQTQAEDRDHDRLLPVFDAMLTSLCQHLTGIA